MEYAPVGQSACGYTSEWADVRSEMLPVFGPPGCHFPKSKSGLAAGAPG